MSAVASLRFGTALCATLGALVLAGCGPQIGTPAAVPSEERAPVEETTATGPRSVTLLADDLRLDPGECTRLQWGVEGALRVYLDGRGVDASGSREVCPDETTTVVLDAVLADSSQISRTLTIYVSGPTETPTEQPTKTPVPSATPIPATRAPSATFTPTVAPTPEVFVSFYAKNYVYDIPADDLCTDVIWETRGVTDVQLERRDHGRQDVGATGRQEVCFEEDKVEYTLWFRHPDGREDRRDIEIRRAEPDDDEP